MDPAHGKFDIVYGSSYQRATCRVSITLLPMLALNSSATKMDMHDWPHTQQAGKDTSVSWLRLCWAMIRGFSRRPTHPKGVRELHLPQLADDGVRARRIIASPACPLLLQEPLLHGIHLVAIMAEHHWLSPGQRQGRSRGPTLAKLPISHNDD